MLRTAGHDVHTPTLAGMGEHAHLLSRQITLDTHIEDVTSHIETEELTGVIYVDALVPNDGDTWSSFATPGAAATRYAQTADGLFMPPPDITIYGVVDPADIAWGNRRLRPHPYGCYLSPIRLPNLAAGRGAALLPRLYIDCVEPFFSDFMGLKQRLKADPAWQHAEIHAGHDPMIHGRFNSGVSSARSSGTASIKIDQARHSSTVALFRIASAAQRATGDTVGESLVKQHGSRQPLKHCKTRVEQVIEETPQP